MATSTLTLTTKQTRSSQNSYTACLRWLLNIGCIHPAAHKAAATGRHTFPETQLGECGSLGKKQQRNYITMQRSICTTPYTTGARNIRTTSIKYVHTYTRLLFFGSEEYPLRCRTSVMHTAENSIFFWVYDIIRPGLKLTKTHLFHALYICKYRQ